MDFCNLTISKKIEKKKRRKIRLKEAFVFQDKRQIN